MLIQALQKQINFTQSEKSIATFILNHIQEVAGMTASDLGKVTFTSKASVLRLCQKLDDLSYQEFLRQLQLEIAEKSYFLDLLDKDPINGKTTIRELMDLIPAIYEKAISETKILVQPTILQRIINRMKTAEHIDLYGSGILESSIEATVFKFQSIGISASKQTNINEHAIVANAQKKTVAILVSFTGKNEFIIATARQLSQTNTYVVGIGGGSNKELVELCDAFIETYTEALLPTMEAIAPTIAINYILDILYSGLVVSDYSRQLENAKQVVQITRFREWDKNR